MKIALSNSIFFTQKSGGISRYFVEIAKEIIKKPNYELKIVSPLNKNIFLKEITKKNKISFFLPRYPNSYVLEKLNNTISNYYLKNYNPDVFHETYYKDNFFNNKKIPKIITIYDTIHEKFQGYYSKDKIIQKKKILKSYDHFICISKNTKKDFINLYNIPENKISVIYLAGNHIFKNDKILDNSFNSNGKFILYVGSRSYYKNFKIIVDAIKINKKLSNIKIICFGGEKFSETDKKSFSNFDITQVFGDDNKLLSLYQNALCLIISSKYEGFGLPMLESMQAGCPVIASKIDTLEEIGLDAALYFNPESAEDLSIKINSILENNNFSKELVRKGFTRSKNFSWQKCAEQTLKLYEKLK